ncbi:LOW QUALITY PROTEIN: inactive polyglycylase TTLL10 [Porphyrio hochstetteri]
MASVPTQRRKNTKSMVQRSNQQQAGSLSAQEEKQLGEEIPKVLLGPELYLSISGSNGAWLVNIYCQSRGWQCLYDNTREDYALKWCEIKCQETYYHFKEGRGPCGSWVEEGGGKNLRTLDLHPATFDDKGKQFPDYITLAIKVVVPYEGLFVFRHKLCIFSSKYWYIHQALLLEGEKFDVQSYLLIACMALGVLFFAQGELSCIDSDATSDHLTVHPTNQHMEKNSLYSQLKDETVWWMQHLNGYVNEKFRKTSGLPKGWVFTVFTERMQIMLQSFLAAKHKPDCKLGHFDLITCDFLIEENSKVWLLDMTANPALQTNCTLRDIISTTLYLVLKIFNKHLKSQGFLPLKMPCHFVLLYYKDAAELGQKQPPKLRTSLCTG